MAARPLVAIAYPIRAAACVAGGGEQLGYRQGAVEGDPLEPEVAADLIGDHDGSPSGLAVAGQVGQRSVGGPVGTGPLRSEQVQVPIRVGSPAGRAGAGSSPWDGSAA